MTPSTYILLLIVAVTLLVLPAASSEEKFAEKFVPFSYVGDTAPDKWGSLSPSYATCAKGKSQSPINIFKNVTVLDTKLQGLNRNYTVTNAMLINNGFNIGISFEENGAGTAVFNGKNYTLKQFHWHSPSEHTLEGEQFPVELHLVHKGADGSILVVAVLYEYGGGKDPLVKQFMDELKELAQEKCGGDQQAQIPLKSLKTKHLNRKSKKYYSYVGSLTIPPCVENVQWAILGKVRKITKEQVDVLKAPLGPGFKNNSRPVQQLNGRKVQLYSEVDAKKGNKSDE